MSVAAVVWKRVAQTYCDEATAITAQNRPTPSTTTRRSHCALRVLTERCRLSMATWPPKRSTRPAPRKVTQIIMCRATSSAQTMESPVV